jgi:hypothetical protein
MMMFGLAALRGRLDARAGKADEVTGGIVAE